VRRAVVSGKTGTAVARPLILATATDLPADHLTVLRSFGEGVTLVRDLTTLPTSVFDDRTVGECSSIAVGLFPLDALREYRAFEIAARSRGMTALSLAVERHVLLIGPLSIPEVPACGYCARLRMLGARAARGADADMGEHACGAEALRYLRRKIRAVRQNPRSARRLHGHIVAVESPLPSRQRHRFVAMPYCEVCGGAAAMRGARSTRGLDGWVDPLAGVIAGIAPEPPSETGLESPIVVIAAPPHVVSDDGTVRRLPIGWGKGLSPADAVLSAVGEAIERYAPSLPDPSKTIEALATDLDGPHLDPRRFALYSPEQYAHPEFPFAPYEPSLTHPWVRGSSLRTGELIWVHAAFVHLSLELRRHQLIVQGSSNGLAASTSLDDAARRATLELIERDALMCAWLTGAPGLRVIIDHRLDPQLREIVTGVERLGAVVEVYLLETSAIGTTALCLSMGDGREWPGVTLALGADLNPLAAIRSAILELGQTGPHLRRLMRNKTWPVPADESAVFDMLDHAAYYFPVQRRHHFDHLRHGGHSVSMADLAATETTPDLAACRAAVAAAGVEVILVDVTSPDVRTGPFRVARAVSPDLQGISYGFNLDRSPVPRIGDGYVARPGAVHPVW
jgi:ribosomal protein S12 methylthiotransferase accessory factor